MKSNVISSNAARCFPVQMRWVAAAALVLCTFSPTTAGAQEACPPSVSAEVDPQPVLTAPRATQVLADACVPLPMRIPGDQTPPAYFDHYSWRAFIALVWPASSGQRGVPDQAKRLEKIGDNRGSNGSLISSPPVVFETFKADWEIFQAGGAAPSSWNSNNALMTGGSGTCPMARPGDFMLISVSKFGNSGNIAEAGVGELVSVLVAQNRTFVRYLAAFNEKQFNKILADRLDLLENVKNKTFRFDPGSISIKSSWIDMTTIPNSERFHTREAWVVEPFSNACSKVIVGLVGLHIAQKTQTRPQWIWSTFEHVDNVPPADYVPPTPPASPTRTFTFNDGTNTPMPQTLPPAYLLEKVRAAQTVPAPINIQRLKPINSDAGPSRNTRDTNSLWRSKLQTENSVWQYYQLTMTQWPSNANFPDMRGIPGFTTPGLGSDHSAFANTTLETWDQLKIERGCMGCHTTVQKNNDFVWSLQMNAFDARPDARQDLPELNALKALLQERLK